MVGSVAEALDEGGYEGDDVGLKEHAQTVRQTLEGRQRAWERERGIREGGRRRGDKRARPGRGKMGWRGVRCCECVCVLGCVVLCGRV